MTHQNQNTDLQRLGREGQEQEGALVHLILLKVKRDSLIHHLTFPPRLGFRAQLEHNPRGRSLCKDLWLGGHAGPALLPGSSVWHIPRCHQNRPWQSLRWPSVDRHLSGAGGTLLVRTLRCHRGDRDRTAATALLIGASCSL